MMRSDPLTPGVSTWSTGMVGSEWQSPADRVVTAAWLGSVISGHPVITGIVVDNRCREARADARATVDDDDGAGDVGRGVRGEEKDDGGNLVGGPRPSERQGRDAPLERCRHPG